ncbi:hypothetical protein BC827DRAFT_565849 [Russula dissimulans]|nr:hypothetical protein BC827DRAFT_565849 [Russula dissimulans]
MHTLYQRRPAPSTTPSAMTRRFSPTLCLQEAGATSLSCLPNVGLGHVARQARGRGGKKKDSSIGVEGPYVRSTFFARLNSIQQLSPVLQTCALPLSDPRHAPRRGGLLTTAACTCHPVIMRPKEIKARVELRLRILSHARHRRYQLDRCSYCESATWRCTAAVRRDVSIPVISRARA